MNVSPWLKRLSVDEERDEKSNECWILYSKEHRISFKPHTYKHTFLFTGGVGSGCCLKSGLLWLTSLIKDTCIGLVLKGFGLSNLSWVEDVGVEWMSPFGVSTAPGVCTKLTNVLKGFLNGIIFRGVLKYRVLSTVGVVDGLLERKWGSIKVSELDENRLSSSSFWKERPCTTLIRCRMVYFVILCDALLILPHIENKF